MEVIAEITTITNQFDFTGNYIDTDGNTHNMTIFDTNYFLTELRHNYFSREIFIDTDAPATDIVNIFTVWKQSRGALYAKQAYAYTLAYNPIENYSSNETDSGFETVEHGLKIERTAGQKNTHTNNNLTSTNTYTNVTDTNTHSKYGLNSNDAVPSDIDTNIKSGSDSNVQTGSYEDAKSGKDTDQHSGVDTNRHSITRTRSGNIGVMTAAQMLQAEFDGLKQDLANRALKEFLSKYTFYSGEVD